MRAASAAVDELRDWPSGPDRPSCRDYPATLNEALAT